MTTDSPCGRGHKREDWVSHPRCEGCGEYRDDEHGKDDQACGPISDDGHCRRCAEDRALIERTVRVVLDVVAPFVARNTPYAPGIGSVGVIMAQHIREECSGVRLDQIIEEVLRGAK